MLDLEMKEDPTSVFSAGSSRSESQLDDWFLGLAEYEERLLLAGPDGSVEGMGSRVD